MELIKSIQYINSFIWLLVPIKQFKTRFFLFFLFLGLLDPIYILFYNYIHINSLYYYLYCATILLYLILFNLKQKYRILLVLIFLIFSSVILYYSPTQSLLLQILIHLIIFVVFLKVLIVYFSTHRKLLLFLL